MSRIQSLYNLIDNSYSQLFDWTDNADDPEDSCWWVVDVDTQTGVAYTYAFRLPFSQTQGWYVEKPLKVNEIKDL